ncbi:hypothetical protein BW723_05710 [Polaribacter reichenbachii]|uniref:Peptidase M28 domain-containing protein n=1 Tax=Polaribacter reichenbachii TaxID=996801 RepID=A0A1B8TYH4_9FLAO|nr:M28 family peptidase [Polaribacter reichenbachii]APZ45822.1 hypothetical protein BW723_05710 [Polaribacter reichenbachii]AUC19684.1 hypothetical protein BTO17_13725 [Polaribacter reichenbachii]OBY64746.1 hypothetical protein LPB301_10000 [Polaribacter reichenbachii]
MKKLSSVLSVLIILAIIYWSFYDLKPSLDKEKISLVTKFSKDNALHHLKNISQNAHFVGTAEHKNVQMYIVSALQKMGLETEIQTQTAINKKWMAATTTENILARIKGTENGKALMLLTHYDSSPHSSLGASDAGSGVVTILEGIRAFLANNKSHKNDIIILISDAEELGLLGAQAFVDYHKWAKDVGLVLNFEARGSGGPSYMLMETNGKNSKLLTEFLAAKPNFPVANSLMYSIYKKLPNDTDLTVFRQDANINGFNFAFIDDHFDYHTAQDSYERLDRETLLHQADYLMQSLNYFANSDLENLNSNEDFVYVNFPFIKMLIYPFAWVLPMLIVAIVIFILLLIYGFSSKRLTVKGSLKGFLPFIISVVLCGGISFYAWQLIQIIHPQYKDILHGFTYNGYTYIFAFVFLNLSILLFVYRFYKKQEKTTDLLIAPIFVWLLINLFISITLKGAGFFIIPVFIALLILGISIFMYLDERSKRILFTILSIPTIYIFAPMIQMFPVGLGLKNLFISGILIALIFGLIVLSFYNRKAKWMLRFSGILTIVFFGLASYNSTFSIDNKKPNSIVYIQNSDDKTAYFGTYNNTLDSFTKQIFDETSTNGSIKNAETKSKYNTHFKYHKKTDYRNILPSDISVEMDTIIGNNRFLELEISPKRKVNKLEFITKNKITLKQFKVNDALVLKGKNYTKKSGTFLIYHFANSDKDLTISFTIDASQKLDIVLNEISYDLLTNPNFSINPRSEEMMPMPFVTNDAIIISKKLKI